MRLLVRIYSNIQQAPEENIPVISNLKDYKANEFSKNQRVQ